MNWVLEGFAVFHAGFGFLANNYAQCSSTELLQLALVGTAGAEALRMGLRAMGSERMRRRLDPVNLDAHPILAAALQRAQEVIKRQRPIVIYWAEHGGPKLATLGYFRPSLIVGRDIADALGPEELEAALAHELQHARRRDALRIELGRICFGLIALSTIFASVVFLVFYVGAFGINHLVAASTVAGGLLFIVSGGRVMARRLEREAEFECDRAASTGSGGALAVAAALVKVARLEKRSGTHGFLAMVGLFSVGTFQLRINRLMSAAPGPDSRRLRRLGLRLSATALVALAAVGVARPLDMAQAAAAGCSTCALIVEKSAGWRG